MMLLCALCVSPALEAHARDCSVSASAEVGAQVPESLVVGYRSLLQFAAEHPFWSNSFFRHRRELTFQDWQIFFAQDYYDCQAFTRYIGQTQTDRPEHPSSQSAVQTHA